MNVVIWHNPKCSKSRKTLALLEERGHTPKVRRYLEDAPSPVEIADVVAKLGLVDARALARTKEALYRELRVAELAGDALLEAMSENPQLIERPVVITERGARIGRPPELVLEVL